MLRSGILGAAPPIFLGQGPAGKELEKQDSQPCSDPYSCGSSRWGQTQQRVSATLQPGPHLLHSPEKPNLRWQHVSRGAGSLFGPGIAAIDCFLFAYFIMLARASPEHSSTCAPSISLGPGNTQLSSATGFWLVSWATPKNGVFSWWGGGRGQGIQLHGQRAGGGEQCACWLWPPPGPLIRVRCRARCGAAWRGAARCGCGRRPGAPYAPPAGLQNRLPAGRPHPAAAASRAGVLPTLAVTEKHGDSAAAPRRVAGHPAAQPAALRGRAGPREGEPVPTPDICQSCPSPGRARGIAPRRSRVHGMGSGTLCGCVAWRGAEGAERSWRVMGSAADSITMSGAVGYREPPCFGSGWDLGQQPGAAYSPPPEFNLLFFRMEVEPRWSLR
ncbi:Hypothetical predicted protein [Marmota monax]|uniref:Uncharacterized protein n=1 Tax=Marmota monax TaxID=9995 RepID=A0A5E4BHW3_MARMO|nr:Hypothetical predicted protein [Marmota monax]